MNGAVPPCAPVYLPFSKVEAPLQQLPSPFVTSFGYWWNWYPFAPVVDAGWNQALHAVVPIEATPYHELINYPLPSGIQDIVIPFAVEKVSPVLLLSGPMIVNVVDGSPLTGLGFTVTNLSTGLVAIQLNALLPPPPPPADQSGGSPSNYWFRALVTVVG